MSSSPQRKLSSYFDMPWICFLGKAKNKQLATCDPSEDPGRIVAEVESEESQVSSGVLWALASTHMASLIEKSAPSPVPRNKPYWKWEIGQEDKLFVDFTQLQMYQWTSLVIKTCTRLLSGYFFRLLNLLSTPLHIFCFFPFVSFCYTFLWRTKQDFSHYIYILQGILSSTFVVLTTCLQLLVSMNCRVHPPSSKKNKKQKNCFYLF